MKWKTIKSIYECVLIEGCEIKYRGENRYTLIWFDFDGIKMYETDFNDGVMDGKDITYNADGSCARKVFMKEGMVILDFL